MIYTSTQESRPRDRKLIDVVFIAYDGVQSLDIAGPLEVFAGCNEILDSRKSQGGRYRLTVASLDGGIVVSESGLQIGTSPLAELADLVHTVVIPGGHGSRTVSNDSDFVGAVRRFGENRRVLTVCTGAFIAAAAGILTDQRVATHWAHVGTLQRRFPNLDVDPDPIFIRASKMLWSSAGVTAGIDLALAVVEEDHGVDVAQLVARWLVLFFRRPGGQSQFAAPVWVDRTEVGPIRKSQEIIDSDPSQDLSVHRLADRVGMSERHFARRFTELTGVAPGRYVSNVRMEAARRDLETSRDTVEVIARRVGFGTGETMRRTFVRRMGVSPDTYRNRFDKTPIASSLVQ